MAKTRTADAVPGDAGEFRGGPKMDVAVISGATFVRKAVVYYELEGMAIIEGDIALGTLEKVQAATTAAREAAVSGSPIAFGVGIPGSQFRWPNREVPYEIDPNLPNQQRVTGAIAQWEANTAFRFPLRTPANAGQYPNFVRFTDEGGCWSFVGMQGGSQTISLGAGCSLGSTIHEIGHAIGLWHEQSREDRDLFVTINWQNIQAGMAAQFNQHITDGDDLETYDYGSIMHYPRTAFSANGQDTIVPTDTNAQIGQRNGLSAVDIAAVRTMYPERLELNWSDIGHANDVVAMAAINNKLFAADKANRLWWRDPVGHEVDWQDIGHANDVVAMAAINNKLFAADKANRLWWRDSVGHEVDWQDIGHANDVVAMAAINNKLFAADKANRLWWRDSAGHEVDWQDIGHANDIVAMAAINNTLFAADKANRLWWRDPVGHEVDWQDIGHANDVVAMAAVNNKLFAADKANRLWWRDPGR